MSRSHASLQTLSLFDTTGLAGFGLAAPQIEGGMRFREVLPAQPAAEPVRIPARNFRLVGDRGLARGWKARAADNIAAIRLLQQIEGEQRPATIAEQAQLIKFTGFGASDLANSLFPRAGEAWRAGWEGVGADLERLTSEAERAGLMRSTQYAHYTPEFMIRAIWRALERIGFAGGTVLEPGCGTGLFLALMPEAAAKHAIVTGIEIDGVTARIAGLLHPESSIRHEDFTKAKLTETYNLVVGNPAFSDRIIRSGDAAGRLGLSLHDYFIARSIERLKPGGIAAFVTSRWTLDKTSAAARTHIAGMADLVGAVRLPQGAMLADAGTEVVVDIVFLQKRRDGTPSRDNTWLDIAELPGTDEGDGCLAVNAYFREHPELVLGTHAWTSSPYGPAYTCRPVPEADLPTALDAALALVTTGVRMPVADIAVQDRPKAPRLIVGTAAEGATIKEGSYVLIGNDLHQVIDGVPVPVPIKSAANPTGIFAKHARIVRAFIPIRDAARQILRAQEANRPWALAQSRLRTAYHNFLRQFGPINRVLTTIRRCEATGEEIETQRRPNLQPFADDPDVWLVSSIEDYDESSDTGRPGPIFTERVLHPPVEPIITSAADALAVTLHEAGIVDLPRICELAGLDRDTTLAALGERVFLNPGLTTPEIETWETEDAYLSGPVRTKLAVAEAAAALDPSYARNVDALRSVQPEDLKPSEVTARLGSPWIPAQIVEAFSAEILGIRTRVFHTAAVAAWSVDQSPFAGQAAATSIWGTARRPAGQLLEDALNAVTPAIYDIIIEHGHERRELNAGETEAAKEKLQKLKREFERWIWTDGDRADRMVRRYNDLFNNLVTRRFDGDHLQLPGASNTIALRTHQKRAAWRIISAGSTYLAHCVGAGKTFTLCAAIMEQRRLGLVTKPMMVVPGHCLAQAAREFLQLYPNAKILVADETSFAKPRRQRFLARAATDHWDCIIITHDAFKFIPAPAAFEEGMIRDLIGSYADLLAGVDSDDRISRKRIERLKEGMEAKLEALKARKDDLLTIAEIGIDQLIVDEAQIFRKLSFATNQAGLKGIDPDGSQRAWDLYVKARFIARSQPKRALVMSSGTPITNTLGEMFTLCRFMQPDMLTERGIHEFDAWAAVFGDTRTELELQPSGLYKPVTRFAEFVNVADLMALYRSFADVILKDDLRRFIRLPDIAGGKRQIVTAPASPAFRDYQKHLAQRIKIIEARKGAPQKGDDILLSVITDGRHAAIDLRLVLPDAADEPENKLNALIGNVFRIWQETAAQTYHDPATGNPYALPGAAQMIFSDLGTEAALQTRGFSAYRWIRDALIRLGVPAAEIAFMQDYKKSEAKQRLFGDINSGRKRILIGSTQTMGTGVNAQQRLIALHHLDVPWLVADIEQREGRIERQGNQHETIRIYAYALRGSVDATSWQMLERKARFIAMAMGGDRTIRRLEDVGAAVNQFALAKALASGDPRLLHKAGLEAEIARLERLEAAHFDDQHAVRREVAHTRFVIEAATRRIGQIETDLQCRVPTRGEAFAMTIEGARHTDRKPAGIALLGRIRGIEQNLQTGRWALGRIGGFDLMLEAGRHPTGRRKTAYHLDLWLARTGQEQEISLDGDLTALGLVSRLEHALDRFEVELAEQHRSLQEALRRLPGYEARLDESFDTTELAARRAQLQLLEASLAANTSEPAGLDKAA